MKGVTAQSCQVYKVGGEVERNMYGVSGKFKSSFIGREGRGEYYKCRTRAYSP